MLIKAAESGGMQGQAAFASLFTRHRDYAMRIALRFTGDHESAADAVQEAFIYLMKKITSRGGLILTAKLTTYLYPIIKNVALTVKRKDKKPALRFSASDGPDPAARETPDRTGQAPAGATLSVIVRSLPEHQQEVLILRFVDDMSMEEIAAALSIPVGTVKSRLHLAIKMLRASPDLGRYFDLSDVETAREPNTDPGQARKPGE